MLVINKTLEVLDLNNVAIQCRWCLQPWTQTKFKSDLSSSVKLQHNASLSLAIELRLTETSFFVKGPDCGVKDNNDSGVIGPETNVK